MTEQYTPKEGDKVRVVLEGEVTSTDGVGQFYVSGPQFRGNWIYPPCGNVVSVEKVEPKLPDACGSVVRATRDVGPKATLVRDGDGWRYANGGQVADAVLASFADIEIIFDAGVTSDRNNQEEK